MAKHKQHNRVLRPHHVKPYRRRHLASLVFLVAWIIVIAVEIGIVVGHNQRIAAPATNTRQTPAAVDGPQRVHSAYGYSFTADSAIFTITSTDRSATVRPKPGAVDGRTAAAEFSIETNIDPAVLTAARQKTENIGLSSQQVAGQLFPMSTSSNELSVTVISSGADTLSTVPVHKTVYEFADRRGGKSYAIVWSGVNKDRAFAVKLNGLVGSDDIPLAFAPIFDSLRISADQAVLGAVNPVFTSRTAAAPLSKLDAKYLSDAISPAVVQIFHVVCGVLTVDNIRLGDSNCVSFSGSGFLATASGYIATNGHVVQYSAKDAVANLVVSNDAVLHAYLRNMGLNDTQINAVKTNPSALAALVSRIYDFSDDQLKFADKGELTLVALGNKQPDLKQLANLKTSSQLKQLQYDTTVIKPARLIGANYASKDSYLTIADPLNGFSSSDVALLKVDVKGAPAIPIGTEKVVQNQKIILMGFPGDAGNPLVDATQNVVTVTDGVISAIRQAAGGKGRLYQSDADASHGNSGGPAIDDQGRVIGLLTYRYANPEPGNAAKSYIRDISDFTDLARAYDVTIDGRSSTQALWLQGLELYSKDHYSAALKDFAAVQAAYPAHRLVDDYIASAREAVAAGQDTRDLPLSFLIVAMAVALAGLSGTVLLMLRHHSLHRVYLLSRTDQEEGAPPESRDA